MIKHIIEVSQEPTRLSLRNSQMVVTQSGVEKSQIPCEDIGVIVVDQPQTTYTHQLLCQLSSTDAVVVLCDQNHLPTSILLPLVDHSTLVPRLHLQIALSTPRRKKLWAEIVKEKLKRQAENLPEDYPAKAKILDFARNVKSGDSTNREAQGAKVYWQNWLWQEEFRRDRDSAGINSMLNYGYAIVRASLARAVVAAGLQPSLGLMHRNRANAFCLVDDLIEPYRPMVDSQVREIYRQGYAELTVECKKQLLQLLAIPMEIRKETGPSGVMFQRYLNSLVRCMEGTEKRLEIPKPCL
jgi:CRISPR-associated protein Cas1